MKVLSEHTRKVNRERVARWRENNRERYNQAARNRRAVDPEATRAIKRRYRSESMAPYANTLYRKLRYVHGMPRFDALLETLVHVVTLQLERASV